MSYVLTYEVIKPTKEENQLTPEAQKVFNDLVVSGDIISHDMVDTPDGSGHIVTITYRDKEAFNNHLALLNGIQVDRPTVITRNFTEREI